MTALTGTCRGSAYPGRQLAALVLTGGRARRMSGADKPAIEVGGRTLLGAVMTAAAGAGVCHLVLVGPARPELVKAVPGDAQVEFTTERPPGAGPVPALRAGLALITEPWLLLLAADLPFLRDNHLRELVAAAEHSHAGALLVDATGRPQWLLSCWLTACVRAALTEYEGSSLGGLLGPLRAAEVAVPAGNAPPWLDCDTPEDVAAARALTQRSEAEDERA
jgi:molybdopterin-guanine dinucleotide biosynthesis protein A